MKRSIFISYSDLDKDKVKLIVDELKPNLMFSPIVIASERKALKPLSQKVTDGINLSKLFIPLLTSNSIQTQWINQEIGYAFAKDKQIIPIIEKDIIKELKGFIHNQIDLPYNYSSNVDKVNENENFLLTFKTLIDDMEGKIHSMTLTQKLTEKNQFDKDLELIDKANEENEFHRRKKLFLNSVKGVAEAKKELLLMFTEIKVKELKLRDKNFDININFPGTELSCTLRHKQFICNISWNNFISNSTDEGYLQIIMNNGQKTANKLMFTFDQSQDIKNCWYSKYEKKQYYSTEIVDLCFNWLISSSLKESINETNYAIRT